MFHADQHSYDRFCTKGKLHRSVSMLYGIVDGITADGEVNAQELNLLMEWMDLHRPHQDLHPFNEFFPLLRDVLEDGILQENERKDILWLSNKVLQGELECAVKTDMQILHGLIQGIVADGKISPEEIRHLQEWIDNRPHLRGIWPYDEIGSLIGRALNEGAMDPNEHAQVLAYLSGFCELTPAESPGEVRHTVTGICATCPDIQFQGRLFCVTGSITGYRRKEIEALISRAGGTPVSNVSRDLSYLIVGAQGNPCWAFACYGRKVEHAMQLRRSGSRIAIVHETDLIESLREIGLLS
jgi:NAD-dependent DNA ligase